MWDKLRKQAALERLELRRLLETHSPLLARGGETPPSAIEISALAAMLHSFYTGIENILKRIAAEIDERVPTVELEKQFAESGKLEKAILKNLATLGYPLLAEPEQ